MKVRELIEILQEMDGPEFEIRMWEYDHDSTTLGKRKKPIVNIETRTSIRGKEKEITRWVILT